MGRRDRRLAKLPPPPELAAGDTTPTGTGVGSPVQWGAAGRALAPADLGGLDQMLGRLAAWSVPSIAQALQTIGVVATFPLEWVRRDPFEVIGPLDPDSTLDGRTPTATTLARLVEDLCLWPCGYLIVRGRYADGYPRRWRYAPFEMVQPPQPIADTLAWSTPWNWSFIGMTPTPDPAAAGGRPWTVGDIEVPAADIVVVSNHWPGLFGTASRVPAVARALDNAVMRYTATPRPTGALKNSGADLAGDQIDDLLDRWEEKRQLGQTAYLNANLDYQSIAWDAKQIALTESRGEVAADVARLFNLAPEAINAPTDSSLTYATVEAQRRNLSDRTLRLYITDVAGRLSMPDQCPHGTFARFDQTDWLRSDTTALYGSLATALGAGIMTPNEARDIAGLPPSSEEGADSLGKPASSTPAALAPFTGDTPPPSDTNPTDPATAVPTPIGASWN